MIENDSEMHLSLEEERRRQDELDLQCAMPYAMFALGVFVLLPIAGLIAVWALR